MDPTCSILSDVVAAETEDSIWYHEPISGKMIKKLDLNNLQSYCAVNKITGDKGLILLKDNDFFKDFKNVESLLCYLDVEHLSRKTSAEIVSKPKRKSTNKYAGLRG